MDDRHDEVDRSAHVVRLKAADESIEVLRGRADAEEKGYLDEDDNEGADTMAVSMARFSSDSPELCVAYRHMTLNRMTQWKWKRLAMPRAKQSTTHNTPVLLMLTDLFQLF